MNGNSTYRAGKPNGGFFGLIRDVGVAWRLLWDPAVPGLLKLVLPILALVYWFSPLDLMPGLPFDDIAILLLAARMLVSLAPDDSVRNAYAGRNASTAPPNRPADDDGDVIDTTWRIVDD
jgi:uncharacterized membrane protein YkvA (DUF1232 family)